MPAVLCYAMLCAPVLSCWVFSSRCKYCMLRNAQLRQKEDDRFGLEDALCYSLLPLQVAGGLLSEALMLLDRGMQPNTNIATRAIGYRQALDFMKVRYTGQEVAGLVCRHRRQDSDVQTAALPGACTTVLNTYQHSYGPAGHMPCGEHMPDVPVLFCCCHMCAVCSCQGFSQ